MYDGLADSYNNYNYGTTRSSYYSKLQMGNGSWGYPVRAGARGIHAAEGRTVAKAGGREGRERGAPDADRVPRCGQCPMGLTTHTLGGLMGRFRMSQSDSHEASRRGRR